MPFVSVQHTSSNRLLLSNQDKGCTPSVAHSLALPLGPALHNLCISFARVRIHSAGLDLRSSFERASSKIRDDVTVNLKSYRLVGEDLNGHWTGITSIFLYLIP